MGVINCYLLCEGDHLDNDRHKKEEFTEVINKFKSKYPSALLTDKDLCNVVNMV